MNYIKFKENYNNKLADKSFTTIRIDDPSRYRVGDIYKIISPDEEFEAKLTNIQLVFNLDDIPLEFIESDTGLTTREEFRSLLSSFYGDLSRTGWAILTLRRL